MVNTLYIVEACFLCSTALVALLLCISQVLATRFTPMRKRRRTKTRMIYFNILAAIFQTIRTVDPNGAFRFWGIDANNALTDQVTALLVCSLTVMLAASARSLYAIMNKKQPMLVTITFATIAVAYYTASILLGIYETILYHSLPTVDMELTNIVGYRAIIFEIMICAILISNWYAVFPLRNMIRKFAQQLKKQEEKLANKNKRGYIGVGGVLLPRSDAVAAVSPMSGTNRNSRSTITPARITVIPIAGVTPGGAAAVCRLAELENASRKLHHPNVFVTLAMVVGLLVNTPRLLSFANNNESINTFQLQDPSHYEPLNFIYPFFQNATFFVLIYYAWISPRNWMSSNARQVAGVDSFWRVIFQGLPDDEVTNSISVHALSINANVSARSVPVQKAAIEPKKEVLSKVIEARPRLDRIPTEPSANDVIVTVMLTSPTGEVRPVVSPIVMSPINSSKTDEDVCVPGIADERNEEISVEEALDV